MIQSGKTNTTDNKININYYFNISFQKFYTIILIIILIILKRRKCMDDYIENIIDDYYKDAPIIDTTEDSWEVYDA